MKKRIIFLSIVILIVTCFAGCKMKREIEIDYTDSTNNAELSKEPANPVTIYVEYGEEFDLDGLTAFFYNSTAKKLAAEGYEAMVDPENGTYTCDKDAILFTYDSEQKYLSMSDMRDAAGKCYKRLLRSQFFCNEMSNRLMEWFSEGELENCSRQEAIDACRPLALACGYGNADVTVYAMDLDGLWEAATFAKTNEIFFYGAPDPNYTYVTEKELTKAIEAGDTNHYIKLLDQRNEIDYIEWTKEDEAYLLVYRSYINGMPMDSLVHGLWCIYVPKYGRVVKAEATCPLILQEMEEDTVLITEEEALAAAIPALKLESLDDITVTNIQLVYSPRSIDLREYKKKKVVYPCWRIDYVIDSEVITTAQYENDDGTILISAVDGLEIEYLEWFNY